MGAENIMLLSVTNSKIEPHAVVIDLGLAEMFGPTPGSTPNKNTSQSAARRSLFDRRLYQEVFGTHVGGTPTTMAPEVWHAFMGHGSFGLKCDVYSLGVVMFQLLTGNLPFLAQSLDPT